LFITYNWVKCLYTWTYGNTYYVYDYGWNYIALLMLMFLMPDYYWPFDPYLGDVSYWIYYSNYLYNTVNIYHTYYSIVVFHVLHQYILSLFIYAGNYYHILTSLCLTIHHSNCLFIIVYVIGYNLYLFSSIYYVCMSLSL